jgi:hypothetical protein
VKGEKRKTKGKIHRKGAKKSCGQKQKKNKKK